VVRALDLARESMHGVRRTLSIAAKANLLVVGLASFGFARPVGSILLAHGSTVAAALFNTSQAGHVLFGHSGAAGEGL
jgi:cation transport ATPase